MKCEGWEPSADQMRRIYSKLGSMFPNAALGVGEFGGSENATPDERARILRHYLQLPKLHERDVFFGGYWFFHEDMVPAGTMLWNVLAQHMRQEAIPRP
jgi:hypothetical protein